MTPADFTLKKSRLTTFIGDIAKGIIRMARKYLSLPRDNEIALSEVIGFVLLLALIVAAFSLWMVYVVPINGREDEINQMNDVKDRFTDYKISLDSLWTNNLSGVTLSTSFNLGTGGGSTQAGGLFLPLIHPIASSAVLSVKDTGDTMTINSSSSGNYTVTMGILEYRSENNYWIQQRYYYQSGGVFLSQENGSTYRVSPSFSFNKANNGTVDVAAVNLVPVRIFGGGSIGGNGPVRVDTWIRTPDKTLMLQKNDWVRVSVTVKDKETADMWMGLFNDSRKRGGIEDSDTGWYTPAVEPGPAPGSWSASLLIDGPYPAPDNGDVYLTLQRIDYVVTLNSVASGLT